MRSRRRVLAAVAGVAVAFLTAGLVAGSRLTSPADAAARKAPPKASYVTVPVELRTIDSQVVTRADSSYEDATDIELSGSGPAIVTGLVPEAGTKLEAGKPFLEVTGRPVIALEGVLPMYRGLRPGMKGPDVEQLERALRKLGLDPGKVDGRFDSRTSDAIEKLYDRAGYDPPRADTGARQAAKAAREEVENAEEDVQRARKALQDARKGPGRTARVEAENAVHEAERALADARRAKDPRAIAEAEDRLRLAKARLADLLRTPDTSTERSALAEARERLASARKRRADAEEAADTPLPSAEVVYVDQLPRRIDDVEVERGDKASGVVMSI
ncbi:MAG TPA: peptidoglycan-binding protein, partial [Actinopolymorphaceae bacterium]